MSLFSWKNRPYFYPSLRRTSHERISGAGKCFLLPPSLREPVGEALDRNARFNEESSWARRIRLDKAERLVSGKTRRFL